MKVIKGGRVIDPSNELDGFFDIYIDGKKIVSVKKKEVSGGKRGHTANNEEIIDADGLVIVPGLIDLHCHLREPGFEYKETIESGSMAGAAGGFTTLVAMANTEPVNDNASVTEYIIQKAKDAGILTVLPVGAVTKGMEGKELTEVGELKAAGVVMLSDDGRPVMDSDVMRRALEYSKPFGLCIIAHEEDSSLCMSGAMHEGRVSAQLGLKGIPRESEEILVARDIALVQLTGGSVHFAHISSKGSVDLIRNAKKRGVNVTAEVTPHHLMLDDTAVLGFKTNAKMNPPLTEKVDIEALKEGLKDGTIDAIATDHAPHNSIDKDVEFDQAAFGVSGLETAFPLCLKLVEEKILSLPELISKFTLNPSKILKTGNIGIKAGNIADIAFFDLEKTWEVDPSKFYSKGKNTPFAGWKLKGRAVKTMVGGKIVYEYSESEGR
ncbi:MAG: dihydroorotase [Thermodesulfobacteriota bacterium]